MRVLGDPGSWNACSGIGERLCLMASLESGGGECCSCRTGSPTMAA